MKFTPSILAFQTPETADVWAEKNVVLKETGRFRYDVTPYLREPTRAASDLVACCRVVMKTPAQVGKSQALQNIIGWMAKHDPANSLIIMDSLKTGQRFSKNRLRPFLRDTCNIAAFRSDSKDKSKSVENLSLGSGANLIIGSASSASDLCSTPVKYLFADELDRWTDELGTEGDPLLLAFKRQMRFMGMAVLTSTPTRPEGRINQHFLLGTQEVWSALCPCGCYMRVSYDDIDFSGSTPTYACKQCGTVYSEQEIIALPHLYAPPKNATPFIDKYGRTARSFEVTATLCHQQYTWGTLKREEMQAVSLGQAAISSFRNTSLGEVYVPPAEEILDIPALCRYGLGYTPASIPSWVDTVTIGVDTQHNAFPWTIIGMSADMRKLAIIQAGMILGDLRTPQPWEDLKHLIGSFVATREDGVQKRIAIAAVDSGGHSTQDVYALSMQNPRIRAVKGVVEARKQSNSIIYKVKRVHVKEVATGLGTTDLTLLNITAVKDIINTHLHAKLHDYAVGYDWVWCSGYGIDANFFEQVTSEVRTYNSRGTYYYEKLPGRENHYLDCMVYAISACEIVRLLKGNLPAVKAIEASPVEQSEPLEQPPETIEALPVEKPKPPKPVNVEPAKRRYKPL